MNQNSAGLAADQLSGNTAWAAVQGFQHDRLTDFPAVYHARLSGHLRAHRKFGSTACRAQLAAWSVQRLAVTPVNRALEKCAEMRRLKLRHVEWTPFVGASTKDSMQDEAEYP